MVGSINSNLTTSTANIKQESAEKLIKYVKCEALTQVPDTFKSNLKSSIGITAIFEGLPILKFFKNNKKAGNAANVAMQTLDVNNAKAFKNIYKGDGKLISRVADFVQTANDSKEAFTEIKSVTKAQAMALKTAKKVAETTEKVVEETAKNATSNTMAKFVEGTKKVATKAVETAKNVTNKTTTKFVEGTKKVATKVTGKLVKKNATKKITAQVAKITSKFGKIGKFMKSSGAGVMLAFSGILEGVTEVIPTFKELGSEKGVKQLGKSAVKVAGDTFGFIAGGQVGTALGVAAGSALAGTKVGAAIGSVIPGAGTIIGAVVGCVGGMLGSWAMGKVTKAITGKSEREIAKEEQEKQQAEQFANDNNSLESLKQEAIAKIQAEQETGELSEDSKIAYEALMNLDNSNPFAA